METKLFDAELKVMGVLWREGEATAKHIAAVLGEEVGWNVNTTYTLIKRCINKGAVERREPGVLCRPPGAPGTGQAAGTDELIGKLFDGSADQLFASLLGRKKLSAVQIERLREMVKEME